jgi:hypothetical protein
MSSPRELFSEQARPAGYSNYSIEETVGLQEMFRPTAERYRRRRRIAVLAGGAGLGLLFGVLIWNGVSLLTSNKPLFTGDFPCYVQVVIVAYFVACGVTLLSLPRLRCPLCDGFLDKGVGRYCPECGADGLDSDMFRRPHCKACGKTMLRGKYGMRQYRICACTSCGLLVNPEGI